MSTNTDALSDRQLAHFLPGDSELATRMRALDWSQTPLGAVETWPQSLCTSVNICLQSRFPMQGNRTRFVTNGSQKKGNVLK